MYLYCAAQPRQERREDEEKQIHLQGRTNQDDNHPKEYQGFERLKTPAGEFDCIKLTYTMKANMLLFFSETVNITEWYALGIGLVKSEEYENKEKTKTVNTLIDIKEPL